MIQAITPTREQRAVIKHRHSLVVIAKPGSGKTFLLAEKIRKVLPDLLPHQGVIAISYTNKASDELKRRARHDGIDVRASFFGTIDRFCDNEIIIPFLRHFWTQAPSDLTIRRIRDLPEEEQEQFLSLEENRVSVDALEEHLGIVRSYYEQGTLLLETNGALALYVVKNSAACRHYLRARYSHIFIDEYQDSGLEQHELFLELHSLGLVAVAVGDADQSIFGFSGKDSKYLTSLARQDGFRLFPVTYNHRCHPSIINYSLRLLDEDSEIIDTESTYVYEVCVEGTAREIAIWLGENLSTMCDLFDVGKLSDIGILVRSNHTGELVDRFFPEKHRFFRVLPLEEHFSLWAKLFARLLSYHFDDRLTAQEIIDEFGSMLLTTQEIRECRKLIKTLNKAELPAPGEFIDVARMLLPNAESGEAAELLRNTLDNNHLLSAFEPAADDEVQIITLHKAKGMEFDIVFHLDLYEWVMPRKAPGPGNDWDNCDYPDWEQDLNLHYVGITRARKCCVLCTSTRRINAQGEERQGAPSELLARSHLEDLRGNIDELL